MQGEERVLCGRYWIEMVRLFLRGMKGLGGERIVQCC